MTTKIYQFYKPQRYVFCGFYDGEFIHQEAVIEDGADKAALRVLLSKFTGAIYKVQQQNKGGIANENCKNRNR